MFKYSKYLFANIFSKKGFWATLLISIVTLTVVGLFRINDANANGHSAIDSMDTQTKFMPFIFGVLMTCIIVVYIFKDGVEDGSELMIAAKPLNRNRIILGKFLVLIILIIMYQIIIFTDSIIYAQFDSYTPSSTRWRFASSISVGGIIILLIIGSILSFLAIFLSRIGLLALGIVSSAIIPIVSAIVAPISKGTPHMLSVAGNRGQYLVQTEKLDRLLKNSEEIYEEEDKSTTPSKNNLELNQKFNLGQYVYASDQELMLERFDDKNQNEQREYFDTRWYGKFAKYDVWYQWSGFYDVLMNSKPNGMTPYRWEMEDTLVDPDVRYSMDPTGKTKYKDVFLVMENRSLAGNNFMSKTARDVANKIINGTKIDTMTGEFVRPKFKDANVSLEERLSMMQHMLNDGNATALRYDEYLTYMLVVKAMKEDPTSGYQEPTHILRTGLDTSRTLAQWRNEQSFILMRGDHINIWVGHKYMQRSTKVYIWSGIAAFIFILTVVVYLRRDFK